MFLSSPPATAFNPQMNSVGFGSRRHNSIFAAPISAAACIYYQSGLLASPERRQSCAADLKAEKGTVSFFIGTTDLLEKPFRMAAVAD